MILLVSHFGGLFLFVLVNQFIHKTGCGERLSMENKHRNGSAHNQAQTIQKWWLYRF